jgi:ADP-ribosylglycohydrolase/pimeloyl-ACP methyl ester carboxylesterase
MTSSIFDHPNFTSALFFPRKDKNPTPQNAADWWLDMEPGVKLHARWYPADQPNVAVVLFHGNGEVVSDYDDLSAQFHKIHASLVVIDYRGYGQSTGTPNVRNMVDDAPRILEQIQKDLMHHGLPLPVVVLGRSLGSLCAAKLTTHVPKRCSGFVIDSGFNNLNAFAARRGFDISTAISEQDKLDFDPGRCLEQSYAPLLIIHGAQDTIIEVHEARANEKQALSRQKHLEIVENHGHNDLFYAPKYWACLKEFFETIRHHCDHAAGSIVVQGLGDAIGFLVEGQPPRVCGPFAARTFGSHEMPQGKRAGFEFGQYSDDTQLARELALSLRSTVAWDPADFAERLAEMFRSETIVGRGRATMNAANRLIRGLPWNEAGEPPPTAGNGAAMRAAPVGFLLRNQSERLKISDDHSATTHLDHRARAAAWLVSEVVFDSMHGHASPTQATWYQSLSQRVSTLDPILGKGIENILPWHQIPEDEADEIIGKFGMGDDSIALTASAQRWQGISPFATTSVLYALFAFSKHPDNPARVLKQAIAVGGDVDTVAAIAGAMVGAYVGFSKLEPRLIAWAQKLNDHGKDTLLDLLRLSYCVY